MLKAALVAPLAIRFKMIPVLTALALCALVSSLAAAKPLVSPVEMTVTLDDLPNGAGEFRPGERLKSTRAIIRVLKSYGIQSAIAFVNTLGIESDPEKIQCLRAWVEAGYELGNHTHAHTGLSNQTPAEFIAELQDVEASLGRLNLPMRRAIRYPFLQEGATLKDRQAVRKWLIANHYEFAPPTVDSWDWDTNDKWQNARSREGRRRALMAGVKTAVDNFHYSRSTSQDLFGREIRHTLLLHLTAAEPNLLPLMLDRFNKEGVIYITLDRAIRDPVYRLDPGIAMPEMGNHLEMLKAARDEAEITNGERLHTRAYHARKIETAKGTGFLCQELFLP